MVDKLIDFLENKAELYYDVEFDYKEDDSEVYHFEGQSDAFVIIKLELEYTSVRVFDSYIGDKRHAYVGTYDLLTGKLLD